MPEPPPQFRPIIEALDDVRCVLIGGAAMGLQGCAHLTDDLDFVYERSERNLRALAERLAPFRPRLRDFPDDLPFVWDWRTLRSGLNFTLQTTVGKVDLLGHAPGAPPYEELERRSVRMPIGEGHPRVASVDDLISMKRAANRLKDQNHILELLALKKLLEGGL